MFYFLASIKGWVGRVPAISPNVRVYEKFRRLPYSYYIEEAKFG